MRPENGSIAEKKRQIIKQCLDNTKDPGNIVFLSGDFAKEKLGLSDRNYNTLCHKITAIIHCGCHVNHLYHYKQLALDNVFSTYSLIKLASQGLQKRIIYVSSLSAVLPKDIGSSIAEKIYLDRSELNLVNGYSQSKYASEILLNHAAKKGLDCIIVRPSWVVGDSKTRYFPNKSDHYSLIIRSVLSSCFAPEIDFNFHFIPVDVLAELLVDSVVINRQSGPYIINAKLPQAIAWRRLLRHLNVDNHRIIYNTEKWHHYIIGLDCTSDLFALKLLYETTQHLNLLHKSNIIDIKMANFKSLAKHYKIALPRVYNTDLILRLFGSVTNSKEKHKIAMV